MAARSISFYFPKDCEDQGVALSRLVKELDLLIHPLSKGEAEIFQFTAHRGIDPVKLLIEYKDDVTEEIEEISEWERPTQHFKSLLLDCRSQIVVNYRSVELARQAFLIIASTLGDMASRCVVENGEGCLLVLSDVLPYLDKNPAWSWERKEFPEFPYVAISEWID